VAVAAARPKSTWKGITVSIVRIISIQLGLIISCSRGTLSYIAPSDEP